MWQVTIYQWQVTRDTWQVTCDMWHMTYDTKCGMNILSKCQLPNSSGLGLTVFGIYLNEGMIQSVIQLIS